MVRGYEIIDLNDLSFYQKKMAIALRKRSYFKVAFWQFVRKIKRAVKGV